MFTLCLSLAGILFLILLITFFVLRWIYGRFGKIRFLIVLLAMPLLLFGLMSILPGIQTDLRNTKDAVIVFSKNPIQFVRSKNGPISGNEARLVMWTISAQEIGKHPLGVGTGNVDDYLTESLESYGLHELAEKKYNPHNQFLQTALEIGVPGFAILFIFLFSVAKVAWQTRNKLLLLVLATLVFNSMFESMLQRQTGIVYYSFWICFLVLVSAFQKSPKNV
jgi:O-antigen ligase